MELFRAIFFIAMWGFVGGQLRSGLRVASRLITYVMQFFLDENNILLRSSQVLHNKWRRVIHGLSVPIDIA